jgi:hypothetical protein
MNNNPNLYPNWVAKNSPSVEVRLNGISSHFEKLILIPDNCSKPTKFHRRFSTLNGVASKNKMVSSIKCKFKIVGPWETILTLDK